MPRYIGLVPLQLTMEIIANIRAIGNDRPKIINTVPMSA